ncbi:MAG: glycogen/starch/alpha-glucan phosphorylase [Gammaproteobacteria bacterium]|nr:glycogen/starch/alpha-glucan phosphorylase [Gammaproteobacteria bacterium]MDH3768322.1 glycogen/starch/alpha-glucan phosphorylase [Gammaproteobacteria bacterium]
MKPDDPIGGADSRFVPTEPAMDAAGLNRAIADRLGHSMGLDAVTATTRDWYNAVALGLRDRLMTRWLRTQRAYNRSDCKRVYYLSLEYLIGRNLNNAALNLGLADELKSAIQQLGVDLEAICEIEPDAGLGNGGLGRLAACFLDSLATLQMPGFGYGIRYDYGIFSQAFGPDGEQIERPNNWLRFQHIWELAREELRYPVKFGGRIIADENGDETRYEWVEADEFVAVAYDLPVPGYNAETVNHLRLWSAQAASDFNLSLFNAGQHAAAMAEMNAAEHLSQVLYPDDRTEEGRELRIRQQYFFVSASLQDILRIYLQRHDTLDNLGNKVSIQLNDTHPALAIPELMRICMDEYDYDWDRAWEITTSVFSYTNHTLLPEALETWPVATLERLFPRHMVIIYGINQRLMKTVAEECDHDIAKMSRMSLIDEDNRSVRMANLAIVGSHKVNGVAEIHSRLMQKTVFADLSQFFPGRFINVTNGITPRRWLKEANPGLSELVSQHVPGWENDLDRLRSLVPLSDDSEFRSRFARVKQDNKNRLAEYLHNELDIEVRPDSLFDVHIKRIHEYKRQLLNLLYVVTRYQRIRNNPDADIVPRTVIFSGKAAPAYMMAKEILKLINNVSHVINNDPVSSDRLKLVVVPNYSVSIAQEIIPAADLSQQISTAGMEASGTGNMKLSLNGALTIGTLDGANVEIKDAVGADNIFIFGLTAEQVAERRAAYRPSEIAEANSELSGVLDLIAGDYFSPDVPGQYAGMVDMLLRDSEHYLLLADYESYVSCQDRVDQLYRDPVEWNRKAIINVANMGRFSSDRSIKEYADKVWNISPIPPQRA